MSLKFVGTINFVDYTIYYFYINLSCKINIISSLSEVEFLYYSDNNMTNVFITTMNYLYLWLKAASHACHINYILLQGTYDQVNHCTKLNLVVVFYIGNTNNLINDG